MTVNTGGFWNKPEGKFGMAITGVLGAGFLYGLYKVLPFLLSIAANTLVLSLYFIAIGIIGYVVFVDDGLRNLLLDVYKRIIRACYILLFNVDPIGGLRNRITEMLEKIEVAKREAGKVNGQTKMVAQVVNANNAEYERGLGLAQAAKTRAETGKSTGDQKEFIRWNAQANAEAVKAQVALESNTELIKIKEHLDRSYLVLTDIIEKSELNVSVMNSVVETKERTFKAAKAGRSAIRAAKAALMGDPEGNERFEANVNWIDEFTSDVMGEIDSVLDLNKTALNSIDLQQQSFSDKAFKALEARSTATQHLLSNDPRAQRLLAGQFDAPVMVPKNNVPVAEPNSDLSQFFKQQ